MLTASTAAVVTLGLSGALLAADVPDLEGVPWPVKVFALPVFGLLLAWLRRWLKVGDKPSELSPSTAPSPLPRDTDGQLALAQRLADVLEKELADEKERVGTLTISLAERDGQLVAHKNRVKQLEDEVARLMQLVDTLSGRDR